jgi:uncharacterized protein YjiS (DUF1127 family)
MTGANRPLLITSRSANKSSFGALVNALRDIVTAFLGRKRQNCACDHIRLDREKAGW